jgi:hypothetical protein
MPQSPAENIMPHAKPPSAQRKPQTYYVGRRPMQAVSISGFETIRN